MKTFFTIKQTIFASVLFATAKVELNVNNNHYNLIKSILIDFYFRARFQPSLGNMVWILKRVEFVCRVTKLQGYNGNRARRDSVSSNLVSARWNGTSMDVVGGSARKQIDLWRHNWAYHTRTRLYFPRFSVRFVVHRIN